MGVELVEGCSMSLVFFPVSYKINLLTIFHPQYLCVLCLMWCFADKPTTYFSQWKDERVPVLSQRLSSRHR